MTPTVERLIVYGLIAVAGLTAKCTYDHGQREAGALQERLKATTATLDSVRTVRRGRDTVYRRDTLVRTRTQVAYRELRDTLVLSDTVTVTVRESVLVALADTAIAACNAVVLTCEARVGGLLSELRLTGTQRDTWKARASPSLLVRVGRAALWVGVGYGVRAATVR